MDLNMASIVLMRIAEHCTSHKIKRFFVVFHGGEPLMQSPSFYESFVAKAKEICPDVSFEYGIQTNGTLLTQEWIDLFKRLSIQIGISIDGPEEASKHRVLRSNGMPAYKKIVRGIKLIKSNGLNLCTLSVINTEVPASRIYTYLKELEVDYTDFLYPDVTYDAKADTNLSAWIIEMFDCWYNDKEKKPTIRYFELIIKMLLGFDLGFEALGGHENRTLCVKTNGNIDLVDSLKICGDGFTHTGQNVMQHSFDESFSNEVLRSYYFSHSDSVLCAKCRICEVRKICGGGKFPHRFSQQNGFDNPSVYCESILQLIIHIQKRLFDDLPEVMSKCNVQRLTYSL